jgi:hypothetical protein
MEVRELIGAVLAQIAVLVVRGQEQACHKSSLLEYSFSFGREA